MTLIILEEIRKSLTKFDTRRAAARDLGLSDRTVSDWIKKYDELKEFRRKPFNDKDDDPQYMDMWRRFPGDTNKKKDR